MKILQGSRIPKANGHYSTAIVSNHLLFVSGQLPISKEGKDYENAEFEEQFNVVFHNLEDILLASSTNFQKVVKVTTYLSDVQYWKQFNALFADFIGKHKPVRTVIIVPELPQGYKLEVEIIAEV
ncbi:RidA family protein [Sphingobacterium sp. CZ-2]|uniref:RidA family protein n=1 Tax=Sphingobacterium sp. CZ-2 TaxID=2557994 RepID=UPI00106F5758|nr:RidA family protein [Sphingobacterium sp. CZ-2]QBR12669.1 RidA family protein [Sphingobacterium sp. CZ-2]